MTKSHWMAVTTAIIAISIGAYVWRLGASTVSNNEPVVSNSSSPPPPSQTETPVIINPRGAPQPWDDNGYIIIGLTMGRFGNKVVRSSTPCVVV